MKSTKILLLFIIPFLAFKCSTTKSVKKEKTDYPLEISYQEEIKTNGSFETIIKNISDTEVALMYPHIKNIDINEKDMWRRVKIILCPCGANCEPPPKEKTLKPGEIHKVKWNLRESWCELNEETKIKEEVKEDPKIGEYRITVRYKANENEEKSIVKHFKIIE